MTGIASGAVHNLDLDAAAKVGIETNIEIAERIGVNPAARVTCVKPSGTTSLVLGTSSGIHAWHDEYYIRRIRVGKNEALYTYLSIRHPELLEDDIFNPTGQAVISIPQMAPEGAITRKSEDAIGFLNRIKNFHERWIQPGHIYGDNTHNVSATVTMNKEELPSVGEWIWENKNSFNGLSFMPEDLGSYFQTPFETIDKETYEKLMLNLHEIDVTEIIEISDNTSLMDQSACAGPNGCEIK
jgi:ribonucleoside-diphosphate reductase alpha chain